MALTFCPSPLVSPESVDGEQCPSHSYDAASDFQATPVDKSM